MSSLTDILSATGLVFPIPIAHNRTSSSDRSTDHRIRASPRVLQGRRLLDAGHRTKRQPLRIIARFAWSTVKHPSYRRGGVILI